MRFAFAEFFVALRDVEASWTLSDVLVLVLTLGVAGALCLRPDRDLPVFEELTGLVILYLMLAANWWLGVRGLALNYVLDPVDRALVLGVLLPPLFLWPLIFVLFHPFFMMLHVFPGLVLVIWLVFWSMLGSMIWKRIKARREAPRRSSRFQIAASILVIVLSVVAVSASTVPLWAGYLASPLMFMPGLRTYRAEMKQVADIPAIQAWMVQRGVAPSTERVYLNSNDLPPIVTRICDRVEITESGTLLFVRGGGFGHWGLEVAPKGTPTPGRRNVLHLTDGAWVWQDAQ